MADGKERVDGVGSRFTGRDAGAVRAGGRVLAPVAAPPGVAFRAGAAMPPALPGNCAGPGALLAAQLVRCFAS
ncbi:MAG: hypothetical protein IRZ33_00295 [Alicyclobacillaceae bacterium]|nr:hypothetical protein [Alicyclobacillaceae bacterium]